MHIFEIKDELTQGKSIYDLNLRVTYYARVSTDSEEQKNSLKNQRLYYNEKIANCPNWEFIPGYIDEGVSGKSTVNRHAFNQMIEDAKNSLFDLILTKEISRFARDTLDSIHYTRELLRMGAGVYFENDNINTLFADSELRLTIMASIAQDEIRKLSERVRFGHKRSIEQGKVLGNNDIWGYKKDNGRLVIVEEEAALVRTIFELYANEKHGIRGICNRLTEMGYKNSNGTDFTFNSVQGIIRNPKYKGYYCGKKTEVVDYRTRKRVAFDSDDWIIYKDHEHVPPIIDEITWERANAVLRGRSEKMKSKDTSSYQNKYKYSGKIVCAEHNSVYWRSLYKYDSGDKELWQCRTYRRGGKKTCGAPILYTTELDYVMKEIFSEIVEHKAGYVQTLIKYYEEAFRAEHSGNRASQLRNRLEQIERKKTTLLDMNLEGTLSKEEFKKKNVALSMEVKKLKIQLENASDQKNNAKHLEATLQDMEKTLTASIRFEDNIMEALDMFLDKIKVHNQHDDTYIKLEIFLNMHISLIPPATMNKMRRVFNFSRKIKNQSTPVNCEAHIAWW